MNYVFVLADRSLHSPPLLEEIDAQMESWVFDERDRGCHITIRLCEAGERELDLLDFPTLRRLLRLRHRIHPEAALVFERLRPGQRERHILTQRGLRGTL